MENALDYHAAARVTLFYLQKSGRSVREPWISMIYTEIETALRLKKNGQGNKYLFFDFETTVDSVGRKLSPDATLFDLTQEILDHEKMKVWHERYNSQYQTQADWILAFLEYVPRVGPALGRCLLCQRNTPYLVLIAMLLRTPTSYENAGHWPGDPPKGDFRSDSGWEIDKNSSWHAVSPYIIRAWLKSGQILELDEAEVGSAQDIQVRINNLKNAVTKELESWKGKLDSTLDETPSNTVASAIELALKLDHSLVSEMDAWAHTQKRFSPVDRLDTVQSIRRCLTQADERARQLSQSQDEESRLIGERILTANVCCLVYAGMLLSGDLRESEKLKILSRWPFSIPDRDSKRISETKVKEQLVDHLGRFSQQDGKSETAVGNSRLKLWREVN